MYWTTYYTTLNDQFRRAAEYAEQGIFPRPGCEFDEIDEMMLDPFKALFGHDENSDEYRAFMMGGNLDNESAAAAWYRR